MKRAIGLARLHQPCLQNGIRDPATSSYNPQPPRIEALVFDS
ncbi:MAG: hypothetical protein VX346_19060 [Planctomycetota bacterium]|nr:hypothetical protein [Planctomycetota bacterium]